MYIPIEMSRKIKLFLSAFIAFTLIFTNGSSLSVFANEEISTEPDETETPVEQEEIAEFEENDPEYKESTETSPVSETVTDAALTEETAGSEEAAELVENEAVPAVAENIDLPAAEVPTKNSVKKTNDVAVQLMAAPAGGGMLLAAAGTGVTPAGDNTVSIPFTKTWNDNNNEAGNRPDSIEVTLTYTQGEGGKSKSVTQTVTGGSTDPAWTYTFELVDTEDDPLFYGDDLAPVTFTISENKIEDYTIQEKVDPSIKMTTEFDDDYRVEPCNKLTRHIYLEPENKSWVAVKNGGTYYIWTPEELSPLEKKIIHNQAVQINGFHSEEDKLETFLTGFGEETQYVGFTVDEANESITFDKTSRWSLLGFGIYHKSVDTNKCSITNTYKPQTTKITVEKVWNDSDDQDGLRKDAGATVQLYKSVGDTKSAVGDSVDVGTDDKWSNVWTDLPVRENKQTIVYSVEETLAVDSGYEKRGDTIEKTAVAGDSGIITITNTHIPEKTQVTVVKEWEGDDEYLENRPESITVTLLADGEETDITAELSDSNDWTFTTEEGLLDKYSEGVEIEYTWTEPEVPEGYKSASATEESVTTITNTYTPPAPPAPPVVKINKVDDKGNPVKGAELAVKDGTGEVIVQWTTDGTTYTINDLEVGVPYTLTEIKAPAGYEKAADMKFAPGVGETITLNMVDRKTVVPDTSDRNNTAGWILALSGSMLLGILAFVWRRKYSHN